MRWLAALLRIRVVGGNASLLYDLAIAPADCALGPRPHKRDAACSNRGSNTQPNAALSANGRVEESNRRVN